MENFLNKLYSLDRLDKDRALDLLFETMDEFMWDGRFDVVDKLLQGFDINKCSLTLAVGMLSITLAAKDELPSRAALWDAVYLAAKKKKGRRRATEMMKGLK